MMVHSLGKQAFEDGIALWIRTSSRELDATCYFFDRSRNRALSTSE